MCTLEHQSPLSFYPKGPIIRKWCSAWKMMPNLPSSKPKKTSKLNDIGSALSNMFDSLPPQKKIKELCSSISMKEYLTSTFQWSHIVKKQPHNPTLIEQQYKNLVTELKNKYNYIMVMLTGKDTLIAIFLKSFNGNNYL